MLGWLLLRNLLNPRSIASLLDLCTYLCSTYTSSLSTAALLCYPLVQLLTQSSTALQPFASHDIILSNQKAAASLLKLIEGSPASQMSLTSYDVPVSCSRLYSRLVSTVHILAEVDTRKLQEVTNELNTEKNASHSSQTRSVVLVLSALALDIARSQDIDLLKGILSAFKAVAKRDPREVQCTFS